MNDDSKQMGDYSVESGMEIHVIDNDPHSLSRNGGLEDVSQVRISNNKIIINSLSNTLLFFYRSRSTG